MTDQPAPSQQASLELRAGGFELTARVQVTRAGLLAIGGLVSSILLSTAALVWTATSVRRRHPITTALRR